MKCRNCGKDIVVNNAGIYFHASEVYESWRHGPTRCDGLWWSEVETSPGRYKDSTYAEPLTKQDTLKFIKDVIYGK